MSHVVNHDGHSFRIEIAEVIDSKQNGKIAYAAWCSESFRELKDAPSQACTHFVAGSPFQSRADALSRAQDWIKSHWDAQKSKRAARPVGKDNLVYTVWLFRGDTSTEHPFQEFSDARLFATAAEKAEGITKVGITNSESPEYLTVWEKKK